MDPLFENLQKQVTCSICLDTFTEPKTISCLHTFCSGCLERHARVSQKQGKYRCPECQAKIDLPEGSRFDRLPNSSFHISLLDTFKARDRGAVQRLQQEICSQHNEETVRYYCFACEACICSVCLAEEHQGHEFDVLEKVEEENKKHIMSSVDTIKAEVNLHQAEIGQFEKTFQSEETAIAAAKREVSEVAEHVITKVREQEKQLLESLELTRTERIEPINSAKEQAETLVKQMIQAAEFGENLVQRGSTADIIQSNKTLRRKFEELREVEVPKQRQTAVIKFTAVSQHNFNLGSIQVSENLPNTAKSTLDGLDQAFQPDVQEELTLCSKLSGGEMNVLAGLKDQIQFLMNPVKNATNVILDEKGNGNLKMMFAQEVSGAGNSEVNMDGDELTTCPMTVPVRKPELVVVGELQLKFFPTNKPGGVCGIAANTKGEIAVTDHYVHCVHVFDTNGNCLKKIGSKGNHKEQLRDPIGISFLNDDEVLIADESNNRIQRLNIRTGTFMTCFGKNGRGKGEFYRPTDVTVNDEKRIVITEQGNNKIHVMSEEEELILKFGSNKLSGPTCCIPYKDLYFVSDGENHCIKVFDQKGKFLYKFGKRGKEDGQLRMPYGLLVDSSENLLVCDYENDRVQQFSLDGRFLGKSVTRLPTPIAITTTPDGNILVTSDEDRKVYILKENIA